MDEDIRAGDWVRFSWGLGDRHGVVVNVGGAPAHRHAVINLDPPDGEGGDVPDGVERTISLPVRALERIDDEQTSQANA